MAIVSSSEITLTRVDDGQDGADGYSPQVTVTPHQSVPSQDDDVDKIDINVEVKDNQTGVITTNTTTIKKADRIYTALQDLTTFNQLTDGGVLQGMFVDDGGHAYFNGTYLRAEGADIGGFTIGQTELAATCQSPSSATIASVGGFKSVISSNVEYYDPDYDTESRAKWLTPTTSRITPAIALGIDRHLVISQNEITGESEEYYEEDDINTARLKILHDGSLFVGRHQYLSGFPSNKELRYTLSVYNDGLMIFDPTKDYREKDRGDWDNFQDEALNIALISRLNELETEDDDYGNPIEAHELVYFAHTGTDRGIEFESPYINLKGDIHVNGHSLSDVMHAATRNSTYVTGGSCRFFQVGNAIVLIFRDVTFAAANHGSSSEHHIAFSGLPVNATTEYILLTPFATNGYPVRLRLRKGNLEFHYINITSTSTQYYGFAITLLTDRGRKTEYYQAVAGSSLPSGINPSDYSALADGHFYEYDSIEATYSATTDTSVNTSKTYYIRHSYG